MVALLAAPFALAARPATGICERLLVDGHLVATYVAGERNDDGINSDVVVIRNDYEKPVYDPARPEMPADQPGDSGSGLPPDLSHETELPLQEIVPDRKERDEKLPVRMPMEIPLNIFPVKKPAKPLPN